MAITLFTAVIVLFSFICIFMMIFGLKKQAPVKISAIEYVKLTFSGILAFIADTVGVGSFAVNVALAKLLGTFNDDELPAVNNGAQVIPGMLESLFFLKLVDVDLTTLLTLVIGTCVGGLLGGFVVSRLSKQAIRLAMVCCFTLLIGLLLCHQLRLMPIGGDVSELHGYKLVLGFFAMLVCGALTSVGVGLFVMVQGVLFLLNVSPVVAFPIMTTAGALQQPLTTMVFVKNNKIPLKKAFVLSIAGCVGVAITLPWFSQLTVSWLHTLLLLILTYNLIAMSRAYLQGRPSQKTYPDTSWAAVDSHD